MFPSSNARRADGLHIVKVEVEHWRRTVLLWQRPPGHGAARLFVIANHRFAATAHSVREKSTGLPVEGAEYPTETVIESTPPLAMKLAEPVKGMHES